MSDSMVDESLCIYPLNLQRNPVSNVELSLVIFNSHGSFVVAWYKGVAGQEMLIFSCIGQTSIQFAGGGFSEAATAEGLAEALMMFPPPSGQAQLSNVSEKKPLNVVPRLIIKKTTNLIPFSCIMQR